MISKWAILAVIACCMVTTAAEAQHLQLRKPIGKTHFLEQSLQDKQRRSMLSGAGGKRHFAPDRRQMRHFSRPDPRRLNPAMRGNRFEAKRQETHTAVPVQSVTVR